MTEANFTPGPWTIEEYGDDEAPALVIHRDSESRVCFMATPGSHGDPAQIEADARLIAAAPDMLETLQKIRALVHVPTPSKTPAYTHFQRDFDQIRALTADAIAKATGAA